MRSHPRVQYTNPQPNPTSVIPIRVAWRFHPVLSTKDASTLSVIENAESIPSVKRAMKNTAPNHADAGNCANAYGNATNARPGPASTTFSTPTAWPAWAVANAIAPSVAKTATPATKLVPTSARPMIVALLLMSLLRCRKLAYVTITPNARDIEKNICPNAQRQVSGLRSISHLGCR